MKKDLKGKTALITGASSGIGKYFAVDLAKRNADLVIVARREDKLKELKEELEKDYGVKVMVEAMDLAAKDSPEKLYNKIKGQGVQVDILINNAGFGIHKPFSESKWETHRLMLELMVVNLTHLTRLYVTDMLEKNYGKILMVASTGAYQPVPRYAAYAAAKSYILNFGIALGEELRKSNVSVTVLCPGATASEFQERADQEITSYVKLTMMSAQKVAEIGIKAMLRGKHFKTPGLFNAFGGWLMRSMPRKWTAKISGNML